MTTSNSLRSSALDSRMMRLVESNWKRKRDFDNCCRRPRMRQKPLDERGFRRLRRRNRDFNALNMSMMRS